MYLSSRFQTTRNILKRRFQPNGHISNRQFQPNGHISKFWLEPSIQDSIHWVDQIQSSYSNIRQLSNVQMIFFFQFQLIFPQHCLGDLSPLFSSQETACPLWLSSKSNLVCWSTMVFHFSWRRSSFHWFAHLGRFGIGNHYGQTQFLETFKNILVATLSNDL